MTDPRVSGVAAFPKTAIEQSIPDRFEEQTRLHSDWVAIQEAGRSVGYGELNARANRLAHAILELGVEPPQPIGLLLPQGTSAIAAVLGVLKSGNAYVPLDPDDPSSRIASMLRHSGAELILTDEENAALATSLDSGGTRLLSVDQLRREASEANPGVVISPDALAYIFYTSGSTGEPKGVVDNHRNVLHNIWRYTNGLGIRPHDRLTLLQSCAFSGSVSSLFTALLNGATVCPYRPRLATGGELVRWVTECAITVWHSVPTLFRRLCQGDLGEASIRLIRLEGDQTLPSDIALFKAHFAPGCTLVNGLGATETGITRCYFVDHDTEVTTGIVPIGEPVEDMKILLVDDDGTRLGFDRVGEIVVKSRYLAVGYWGQPERTEAAFHRCDTEPDFRIYHTGDLGRMRSDGCLELLGRKNLRVKVHGQSVEIAEVEATLCYQPGVREAVVDVCEREGGETGLHAFLVAAKGSSPTVSALRRGLEQRLPSYMVPATYTFLDALPVTDTGKIDRAALPGPDTGRPRLDSSFTLPETPTEKSLAALWSDLLEADEIGADDDFFELGGESLAATQLLGQVDVPVATFLRNPTIRALAAELDRSSGNAGALDDDGLLVRFRAEGSRPPLFCLPGHEGTLLGYRNLAGYLPDSQPVIGLSPPSIEESGVRFAVEELAARYVEEIRNAEPEGPYLVSGICFGGYVAFEVARRLSEDGGEVLLLVLVDSFFEPWLDGLSQYQIIRAKLRLATARALAHARALRWSGLRGALDYASERLRLAGEHRQERREQAAFDRCLRNSEALPAQLRQLRLANRAASRGYRPGPFSGRTLIVAPADPRADSYAAPCMGWEGLLLGDIEVQAVPNRLAGLLSERAARSVARHIERAVCGVLL